jgi:hypothetical protein
VVKAEAGDEHVAASSEAVELAVVVDHAVERCLPPADFLDGPFRVPRADGRERPLGFDDHHRCEVVFPRVQRLGAMTTLDSRTGQEEAMRRDDEPRSEVARCGSTGRATCWPDRGFRRWTSVRSTLSVSPVLAYKL